MINEDNQSTLLEIHDSTDYSDNNNVPWLRVGNLYLSFTTTGNLSWPPVLMHLHGKGHRIFRVFSGRHGSAGGGFGLDGTVSKGTTELSHFIEDKNTSLYLRTGRKEGLMKEENPGRNFIGKDITLTVEDFGTATRDKVKFAATAYLNRGETVIFAWCYSIASMYLYNAEKQDLETGSMQRIYSKTVEAVVRDKYRWVKRFINQAY